MASPSAP
jgi:ankyrin repeat protein